MVILESHFGKNNIFKDDKRFSLDGPDNLRSYIDKSSKNYHVRRQCGGGGVMIWMIVMPNWLLSFKVIARNLNSRKYITHNVVPIMKLNHGKNWFLQEDKASVHKSMKVKDFMIKSRISVLEWPP